MPSARLAKPAVSRSLPTIHALPTTPGLRPAIFIDKDGTLVENVPYNVDAKRLRFMPGATEALAGLAAAGFALVIISNQSGIARGHFTLAQFMQLRHALEERLLDAAGVVLTDFLFCPHEPDRDGHPVCACRKPSPGMLLEAARTHRLDLSRSWMIGDTLDDVEAGRRAGCRCVLYDSGGETLWRRTPMRTPDLHGFDWDAVLRHILHERSAARAAELE